jgi:hypothetical protein
MNMWCPHTTKPTIAMRNRGQRQSLLYPKMALRLWTVLMRSEITAKAGRIMM